MTEQTHDDSSTITSIRQKCLASLIAIGPNYQSYMEELENKLFEVSGQPQVYRLFHHYYRKYIQIVYNLKRHLHYLVKKYPPSVLLFLDSVDLNPDVKKQCEQNQLKSIEYKKIQNPEVDESDDMSQTMKCPKCHQPGNISVILRQLRSADEPASCFFSCNKQNCYHKWRVG
jgi:DNA-directed RNA polymerase subunit M/transcription elongation factor TFIIS